LIAPPPVYHSLRYLLEPIFAQEAVIAVATRLMKDIVHVLERDGVGARALRLSLYRVDGDVRTIDIGLSMPTRSVPHGVRLFDLKLERVTGMIDDAGFGFETLGLAVTAVDRMEPEQIDIMSAADQPERCATLIDSLKQRLGPHRVRRLAPVASHLPERAETSS